MATYTTAADKKFYSSGQTVDYFKNIHDGLLDVGLTKTADTGQIDLTTAPTVTTSNANYDYGYNIFQFIDAFQSTYPIFLKVRYMNDNMSGSYSRVTVRIEVGEGTDGSGTLTGKTDTQFLTESNTVVYSDVRHTLTTNNICFTEGTLIISTGVVSTGGRVSGQIQRLLAVGRRKDMSGNFTEGAYKIQHVGEDRRDPEPTTRVEESHISNTRTNLGILSHKNFGNRSSILTPYHWASENTSMAYDNTNPVLPIYTLTPVPEVMSGVVAVTVGVGLNNTFTTDLGSGVKTFLTTDGFAVNSTSLRIAHIWE